MCILGSVFGDLRGLGYGGCSCGLGFVKEKVGAWFCFGVVAVVGFGCIKKVGFFSDFRVAVGDGCFLGERITSSFKTSIFLTWVKTMIHRLGN